MRGRNAESRSGNMTLTYELTRNGRPDQLQNVPQPESNYLIALLAEAVLMLVV